MEQNVGWEGKKRVRQGEKDIFGKENGRRAKRCITDGKGRYDGLNMRR